MLSRTDGPTKAIALCTLNETSWLSKPPVAVIAPPAWANASVHESIRTNRHATAAFIKVPPLGSIKPGRPPARVKGHYHQTAPAARSQQQNRASPTAGDLLGTMPRAVRGAGVRLRRDARLGRSSRRGDGGGAPAVPAGGPAADPRHRPRTLRPLSRLSSSASFR